MYKMQHNYRSCYLLTSNDENARAVNSRGSLERIKIYKDDRCKFEEAFLVLRPCKIVIGESRNCGMTEMSGPCDSSDFDGITILLGSDVNESILISGFE